MDVTYFKVPFLGESIQYFCSWAERKINEYFSFHGSMRLNPKVYLSILHGSFISKSIFFLSRFFICLGFWQGFESFLAPANHSGKRVIWKSLVLSFSANFTIWCFHKYFTYIPFLTQKCPFLEFFKYTTPIIGVPTQLYSLWVFRVHKILCLFLLLC